MQSVDSSVDSLVDSLVDSPVDSLIHSSVDSSASPHSNCPLINLSTVSLLIKPAHNKYTGTAEWHYQVHYHIMSAIL